ncbi:MAG TPA: glycosyltransferase family 8 protein [Caulobacteraceae bacterium]
MTDPVVDGLNEARVLFQKRKFAGSTEVLTRLNQQFGEDAYRSFCIGRNFLYDSQLEPAKTWLRKSLSLAPFAWAFYELAVAEERSGSILAAGQAIFNFVQTGSGDARARGYNAAHIETLLRVAGALFAADPALAISIYDTAASIGLFDYESSLRIIEHLIASGEEEEARERLASLQATQPLDSRGLALLSRLRLGRGEPPPAPLAVASVPIEDVAAVVGPANGSPDLLRTAGRLIETARLDEAERLLDDLRSQTRDLETSDVAQLLKLEFRLAGKRRDVRRVAKLFVDFEFAPVGEQIEPEVLAPAEQLRSFLENRFSAKTPEVRGLLRYYSRRRLWPEATRLLDAIKDLPVFSNPSVVMARLELTCVKADLDAAEAIYEEYFAGRELTQWQGALAVRFLAERKRWTDAAEVLKHALVKGYPLPGAEYQLLKVARQASMREEILAVLDEATHNGAGEIAGRALEFRQMLIDDLCMERGAGALPGDGAKTQDHTMSDRNRVLSSQEAEIGLVKGRTALYLCTDKNYFLGVLTFLASFAAHNHIYARKVKVFVFMGADVPADWQRILTGFGEMIGHPIEVVWEKDFVFTEATHSGSWGFFSGGAGLSRAAYFRIYAAHYLRLRGEFDRLCYIDSDIVCQGDLGELFSFDLQGHPIGARCEEPFLEVGFAAERNSIDPDAYFNSGVLLMDIAHDDIIERLDQAIHLSEHEPGRLFFLDQCALNIAFQERVRRLPPEFNFFVRPYRPVIEDIAAAKLLHFVAAPKPWDISYMRETRELWSRNAQVVKLLLKPSDYRQIVRAANGGKPTETKMQKKARPRGVAAEA